MMSPAYTWNWPTMTPWGMEAAVGHFDQQYQRDRARWSAGEPHRKQRNENEHDGGKERRLERQARHSNGPIGLGSVVVGRSIELGLDRGDQTLRIVALSGEVGAGTGQSRPGRGVKRKLSHRSGKATRAPHVDEPTGPVVVELPGDPAAVRAADHRHTGELRLGDDHATRLFEGRVDEDVSRGQGVEHPIVRERPDEGDPIGKATLGGPALCWTTRPEAVPDHVERRMRQPSSNLSEGFDRSGPVLARAPRTENREELGALARRPADG
jgi:hypothetical protein